MKRLVSVAALGTLLSVAPWVLAAPESDQEKLGYSLGVTLGESLKQDVADLDLDSFTQAIKDVYAGGDLALSEEDRTATLQKFQQKAMEEQNAKAEEEAAANLAAGEKFLAENADKEGVEVTDSGLQYKVLEAGKGDSPGKDSTVKVHYEGKLLDDTVFDSSYQRGEPVNFRVGQVIEGWQEALQLMKPGATWMVYIPAKLGYGAQGQGPIGPNETLIFKVELLEIDADDAS